MDVRRIMFKATILKAKDLAFKAKELAFKAKGGE